MNDGEDFVVPEYRFEDVLLHIDGVSYTPPGGSTPILRDVSAAVYDVQQAGCIRGQIVGLLGPSGVGKTTLFRIMAGLLEPTSGHVLLDGHTEPVKAGQVGVVAQNYRVLDHRTVLGNLLVSGAQNSRPSKETKDKAADLLRRFGLGGHEKKFPQQLSGGQRQRLAIAQQLMCGEHFLLMDEPFSGLDPVMKERVCELILEVSSMDEKNTIIVVTHDIQTAVVISDLLWLMGRERDVNGSIIPGARIIERHNLIDIGLAWQDSISTTDRFHAFVDALMTRFQGI